ncbi:HpcH/HpaI aldolase/citrate lyase family protein [Lachnospiraceae bacterium NSJ-143]|nr:HpcH/HpaI aldolase/citrate lyase family protein [Lachnospiraceae bacterium NSJ-143]
MADFIIPVKYMPYAVGALLYTPANNSDIADSVINGRFGCPYSLSLCLEDSISDMAVQYAEDVAVNSVKKICMSYRKKQFYMPNIFIRVRRPEQIERLFVSLGESVEILTGFILPKFFIDNADGYIESIINVNEISKKPVYMMPIIESHELFDLRNRYNLLYNIKEKIDTVRQYVLNVRVGGNDFCKYLGVRRHADQTIYDISSVNHLLGDIISCFSGDYIVSGPVWEYFSGDTELWKSGMEREIRLDRLNGFVGKTVIHPNQISVANKSFKIAESDYRDAKSILSMSDNTELLVEKSDAGERMNEYKTHVLWAEKTIILADIYGVEKNV